MKKGFLMTFALLLVAVGAYFVSGTYARYTEEVTQEGTAAVAKWSFGEDNKATIKDESGNITENALVINLAKTYDTSSLAEGKIAPGTQGSFVIALGNKHTDTAVDVTVAIAKNVPTNLKFYTDEHCTNEFTSEQLTATLAANAENIENKDYALEKIIYWKWNYNTEANLTTDTADTDDGKEANPMTVKLTITGTQKAPTEQGTAVESKWTTPTETPTV